MCVLLGLFPNLSVSQLVQGCERTWNFPLDVTPYLKPHAPKIRVHPFQNSLVCQKTMIHGLLMENILKLKATHHHHITIIFSQLYQAKQSKLISPSSRVTSTVLFNRPKAPTVSLNYSLSFHWLPGWLTLFFHSSWAENIYCNEWVKVPSAVLVANSQFFDVWLKELV